MKFRSNLRAALLALVLASCSQEKSGSTQRAAAMLPDSVSAATVTAPVQHAAPAAEEVARNLIKWYALNMEKLPADFIVNADGADTTKFYAVNFPGTEAWLTSLKVSGCFSDAYLNAWRTYFRQQNDSLRIHPQNDGPPAGFEYDFILYSQEADSKIQDLQTGRFSSTLSDMTHALVEVMGHPYSTEGGHRQEGLLLKISQTKDGRWIIDDISNSVYSLERT